MVEIFAVSRGPGSDHQINCLFTMGKLLGQIGECEHARSSGSGLVVLAVVRRIGAPQRCGERNALLPQG